MARSRAQRRQHAAQRRRVQAAHTPSGERDKPFDLWAYKMFKAQEKYQRNAGTLVVLKEELGYDLGADR